MNKIKKMILITIIFSIIVIIVVLSLLIKNLKEKETEVELDSLSSNESNSIEDKYISLEDFFLVESCAQKYFDSLNNYSNVYYSQSSLENGERKKLLDDEKINKIRLDYLNKTFLENNNISSKNMYDYIKTYNENITIFIEGIKAQNNDNINKYLIYGLIINKKNEIIDRIFMYLSLDSKNQTFSIEPILNKQTDIDKEKINISENEIERNTNNRYIKKSIDNEDTVSKLMSRFVKLINIDAEIGYNHLDSEYRNKKFGNIDKYKEYIKENYDRLNLAKVNQYKVNDYEEYTQYICLDNKGCYYIFNYDKEKCNYYILLDTYTTEIQELKDKYEKSKNAEKISMNVAKFIEALNLKDYDYIYSKLDKVFANNNYENVEKMKEFFENNLYKYNEIYSYEYKEDNGVYIFDLQIANKENERDLNKKITIVIKLVDNSDYVMSFSKTEETEEE